MKDEYAINRKGRFDAASASFALRACAIWQWNARLIQKALSGRRWGLTQTTTPPSRMMLNGAAVKLGIAIPQQSFVCASLSKVQGRFW